MSKKAKTEWYSDIPTLATIILYLIYAEVVVLAFYGYALLSR